MTLDPSDPRDALVVAARRRLLTHGIDALRSQMNASVLSKVAPVSRDTAYRVFRDHESDQPVTDLILTAVVDATHDPSWSGREAAMQEIVDAYTASVNAGDDPMATWIAAMRANFEAQFRAPGVPSGWLLHAAALTASRVWEGEPAAAEGEELAQKIIEIRRAEYQNITDQFVDVLAVGMSDVGRRPRAGTDARSIVVLVHALLDGAVFRRSIEPDAVSSELVAEAMCLLALAFSESGPADDPRKPGDERNQRLFDQLLEGAAELWRARPEITVDAAAEQAHVPPEAAHLLFPDVGDLADSLLRARVVAGGFIDPGPFPGATKARQHLPVLLSTLQRLRNLADEIPHALAASRIHHPTRSKSFVDDFVSNEVYFVDALEVTTRPEQLLQDMLGFAAQGTPGWPSVMALLRTLGYDTDPTDPSNSTGT